ncbi:MAG: histidine kinase [Algoriphagus sp.]|uniref:sensor histidine kinase n=1 Tax=Algoriphagus sp. TaxID=1872435 RepID=UPI00262802AE|nr:histidine kinase [Algoriphagus sp.]MDG1276829.1 histidine kinase [Algoriphagus sp.]
MKSQALAFRQIEWWIVTSAILTSFIFILFGYQPRSYNDSGQEIFKFTSRLIILASLYGAFHLIHMVLIPKLQIETKKWPSIVWIIVIGLTSFAVSAIFGYNANLIKAPFPAFYLGTAVLYICFLLGTHVLIQALTPPKVRDFQLYNISRLIFIYLFIFLFLLQLNPIVSNGPSIIFGLFIPVIFIASLYNFFLVYGKRKQGLIKQSRWYNWGLMALLLLGFIIISAEANQEEIFFIGGLGTVTFIQLLFFPLTSLVFKKYDSYIGQITSLSTQVNQGSANLSFLKSQINPHFLFNALNTLYGSALTENAEKTSDGIQKLGDMMRFMLHENLQDKISIKREIEYLQNYLDIQLLRFGKEPNLELSIQIQEDFCEGEIAPMMLIPFIENAFKHGISTKNKSWIKINLRCLKGSIHLDVVNSVHPKKATEDPKDESGIGLDNVRKRLDLLYPNAHSLTIVGNDSEHFVHFSLQLK